jgi:tRNA nucleotidyltransferase (CCA-adding enzyme)
MTKDTLRLPDNIKKIFKIFKKNKAELYIVGGAVRDIFLKREIDDWDFATDLRPEEMKEIFPKNSFYNNDFGTFSVIDGENIYEITTYRTERGYSDSRHPDEIRWGETLEEDLLRRDFTINAMAMDENCKIVDIYNGRKDLDNKLIRCVGKPDDRFSEDALRMVRAVRIATQIDFQIEEKTFKSIQTNAELIDRVSPERIKIELFKILALKNASKGIVLLKDSGLLNYIIPELLEGFGMVQKGHHIYDVWEHGLKALDNCTSNDPVTKFATLLHDVGKPNSLKIINGERTFHNHDVIGSRIALRIGKILKLSNKELDQLFRLVRWHMFTVSEVQTDKAVRRFIRNVTPGYIDEMIALRRADRVGSGAKETSWRWELFKKRIIEVQKQPFSVKELKIDGNDVMKVLEIKPGKKVGEILNKIFSEVEEKPELNERETLLKKIKKFK